jgi:hypothetical protein
VQRTDNGRSGDHFGQVRSERASCLPRPMRGRSREPATSTGITMPTSCGVMTKGAVCSGVILSALARPPLAIPGGVTGEREPRQKGYKAINAFCRDLSRCRDSSLPPELAADAPSGWPPSPPAPLDPARGRGEQRDGAPTRVQVDGFSGSRKHLSVPPWFAGERRSGIAICPGGC